MQAYLASFLERDFDKVELLSCFAFAIVFLSLVFVYVRVTRAHEADTPSHLSFALSHQRDQTSTHSLTH